MFIFGDFCIFSPPLLACVWVFSCSTNRYIKCSYLNFKGMNEGDCSLWHTDTTGNLLCNRHVARFKVNKLPHCIACWLQLTKGDHKSQENIDICCVYSGVLRAFWNMLHVISYRLGFITRLPSVSHGAWDTTNSVREQ